MISKKRFYSFCYKILMVSIMAVILMGGKAFGKETKNNVSLLAGINFIGNYGSAENYAPGSNDFPVIPAHHVSFFAVSYARKVWKEIYAEIDFRSYSATEITLVEPVTRDEIALDTLKHISITANGMYRWNKERFAFYAVFGAGIDKIAKTATQVLRTKMNYEVTIEPPADLNDVVIDAGIGTDVRIWKTLSARLDIRYFYIFSNPDPIRNTNISAGVSYSF